MVQLPGGWSSDVQEMVWVLGGWSSDVQIEAQVTGGWPGLGNMFHYTAWPTHVAWNSDTSCDPEIQPSPALVNLLTPQRQVSFPLRRLDQLGRFT